MNTLLLVASVFIAFPGENARVPYVEQCYVSGYTTGPETNLVIAGASVAVHRTGGWVTMVSVHSGTNVLQVGDCIRKFVVDEKPSPLSPPSPPRVYKKLPYAADRPVAGPAGKAPSAITVVVDAGHGGHDRGAVSPHELPEKDANLRMAKAVARELEQRGYRVLMTRTDDTFVELYERPRRAHELKADAFISIHHNAPGYSRDPRSVRYHAVYAWNDLGKRLAGAINRNMAAALGSSLPSQGVIGGNLAVTRSPEIPSCLVEVDFLTTPEGELDCWDPERRDRIAAAIAKGFADWTQGN